MQEGRLGRVGLDLLPAESVDQEDAVPVGGGELGDRRLEAGDALPRDERRQQIGERTGAVLGHGRGFGSEQNGVLPGGLDHQRVVVPVTAVASESDWAKARVWRTVSGPSPASLTRRLRSSAVELPV